MKTRIRYIIVGAVLCFFLGFPGESFANTTYSEFRQSVLPFSGLSYSDWTQVKTSVGASGVIFGEDFDDVFNIRAQMGDKDGRWGSWTSSFSDNEVRYLMPANNNTPVDILMHIRIKNAQFTDVLGFARGHWKSDN